MKNVFLSYGLEDRSFAKQLSQEMLARGLVVLDPLAEPSPGDSLAETLRNLMKRADALVAIVPRTGTRGANNVFFEIGAASAIHKPVLGIVPDRSDAAERQIPTSLLDVLVLDAANKPTGQVIDTLFGAVAAE